MKIKSNRWNINTSVCHLCLIYIERFVYLLLFPVFAPKLNVLYVRMSAWPEGKFNQPKMKAQL